MLIHGSMSRKDSTLEQTTITFFQMLPNCGGFMNAFIAELTFHFDSATCCQMDNMMPKSSGLSCHVDV
jgi:hypothetical protein